MEDAIFVDPEVPNMCLTTQPRACTSILRMPVPTSSAGRRRPPAQASGFVEALQMMFHMHSKATSSAGDALLLEVF
jgi:hypothetical protein